MLPAFHWTLRLAVRVLLVVAFLSPFGISDAESTPRTGPGVDLPTPTEPLTLYTEVLALATVGLMVVAVVQAALFFWQLRYMRIGLHDAQLSANAAKDGAVAAANSVEIAKLAMVAGNRAYVHHNGCRWISHMREADGKLIWRLRPLWTNTGNTPTRQLRVSVKYSVVNMQIADKGGCVEFAEQSPAMIPAKGEIESECFDLTGDELHEIKSKRKFLYVWGQALYLDVFPESKEHVTKFCVLATRLTGDPRLPWHDTNNRFDIHFVADGRHNGVDDECAT
jgi:hypothetical protein